MIWNSLLVTTGGFFGAIARFGLSRWMSRRISSLFPFATFVVNLLGSFLLGLLIGGSMSYSLNFLLGTGFMGAFTTFSTFKLETVQLRARREWRMLILYVGLSYTLGILLFFGGYQIGKL